MHPHPHFDLLLHSDEELCDLLGVHVAARETLHEWPLSCVQRIHLGGGQRWIYKASAGPTVEPEFYAAAVSPVLPKARLLYRDARYACLLIEEVAGNRLDTLSLNEADGRHIAYELQRKIAAIQGDPPVYLDLSDWESWAALMFGMLEDLKGLVETRRFEKTTAADVERLARAAESPTVREAYIRALNRGEVGLVHHDLHSDNVFVSPGSLKIIDWQRPIYGLADIDRVLLLTSLGFDPRPVVHAGVCLAADLLHVHWWTEAAVTWFPPGVQVYDQAVAGIARTMPAAA